MDDINSEFAQADVALVIGANDVTNPPRATTRAVPFTGMPILMWIMRDRDVIKRG